ncbi:MAG: beta-carotene hydroxylase [Bacteroidota bacterium]
MTWIPATLITIATVLTMEFVAWAVHKYVMHGFLWYLHEDHHQVNHDHFFEKNDAFFIIFAVPSMALCLTNGAPEFGVGFWIGLGIAIYGAMYFFVHDIFIHQRFKIMRNTNSVYLQALRKGHKVHHKHLGKEDGECFGMLLVPFKYFRAARKAAATKKASIAKHKLTH